MHENGKLSAVGGTILKRPEKRESWADMSEVID
jgi:hypothetical protein